MRLSLSLTLGFLLLAAATPVVAQEGNALSPRVLDEAALPGVMAKALRWFGYLIGGLFLVALIAAAWVWFGSE